MPALSAQASTFRRGGYRVQGYIGVLPQTIVHQATLSATPTFPVQNIAITTTSGSSSDVKRGMTVRVESAGGVLKGYCRIASSGTISSTALPVNETSSGVVNFASGDVVRVYDTFRIWDMLVGATSSLPKDSRIAYSDQGSNPSPISNAGGGWFGFVDDGQTYATVSFDASVSINVDPDSSTSKTYLWVVGSGATITVGSTTTASITATFPVGTRHVQLTVTDSGNSKATVRQFPVRVYNRSTTRPLAVSSATLEYSHEDGHSLRFEIPKASESAISNLPDGALVCFFVDEYYGDARVSYGSNVSGRSHMKFIGHLVRDTARIDVTRKTVSFEALSPLGILNRTPALPQLMVQNSGTGTLWRHVKTLNTNRIAWYLLHYGATADNAFDFVWQITGSALTYRRIAITEASSVGAQLRDIAQSMNLLVTCDQLGRILLIQDFNYLSSANRASRTTVYDFTTADMKGALDLTTEHRGSVKFVRGEGITDGTTVASNKPVFSNSPGNAPAPFGTGSETLARQIVDTQADINSRTGYHFAKINGLYDGRFVPQGVALRVPPGYGWWDPAYNEPATITLSAADNPRGTAYTTSTKWLASGRSLTFNGETGTVDVTYTIDHETTGQAGTTYIKPQPTENGLPSFPPIDLTMPVPIITPTSSEFNASTERIALFGGSGIRSFLITSDWNTPEAAGGPTWTTVNLAASITGDITAVIADPWSPLYLGTGATVNCWLATESNLYYITDLFGISGRVVTLQHAFSATASIVNGVGRRTLAMERAAQNFIVCANYYGSSGGVTVSVTTDGTNWTETTITSHYETGAAFPFGGKPGAWVSGKIAGTAYVAAYTATGAGASATVRLYRTTNYGASWSLYSSWSNIKDLGYCFHFPWHNNPNDRYLYYSKNTSASTIELYRYDFVTDSEISVDPFAGANTAGSWPNSLAMDSSVIDRQSMAVCGMRPSGGAFNTALYTTRDGGLNWVAATPELGATGARHQVVRFVPNSRDAFYIFGSTTNLGNFTSDFAVSLDNRTGGTAGFLAPIAVIGG